MEKKSRNVPRGEDRWKRINIGSDGRGGQGGLRRGRAVSHAMTGWTGNERGGRRRERERGRAQNARTHRERESARQGTERDRTRRSLGRGMRRKGDREGEGDSVWGVRRAPLGRIQRSAIVRRRVKGQRSRVKRKRIFDSIRFCHGVRVFSLPSGPLTLSFSLLLFSSSSSDVSVSLSSCHFCCFPSSSPASFS